MKEAFDLHELMLNKSFDALSSAERAFVLEQMTQDEYDGQRSVLIGFSQMDRQERMPTPDPSIIWNLKKVQRASHASSQGILHLIWSWIDRPVPAYQLLVVPALLVVLGWLLWPSHVEQIPVERIVTQTVVDTVEVVRKVEIPVEVPVEVERIVYVERNQASELPDIESTDDGPIVMLPVSLPSEAEVQRSFGNSGMKQDDMSRLRALSYTDGL